MLDTVPPKTYELLNQAVDDDIKNYSITVGDPNKKGEGFIADMCFVSLKHKSDDKKVYNFAIKQAFTDEKIRDKHPIRNYFLNEIYFYNKVWPALKKFQKDVLLLNVFDKIPKCFVTCSEDPHETLILDNIKSQEFELVDKRVAIDEDHFKFIFRQYGKFHAISFAYQILNPKEFSDISQELKNAYSQVGSKEDFRTYLNRMHKNCLDNLDPVDDAKAIEKYRDYSENGGIYFRDCTEQISDHSVILHGDCWSNNMMFKHDESGKPIDFRLLDFQLSYLGNPVSDLAYCLYAGGSKEMFDKLDYFLKIYHDSLVETLAEAGCDSDKIYTFEQLKRDWKKFCKIGFTMAIMVWRMKLIEEGGILNLSEMANGATMLNAKFDENYFNKTTKELVLHLYENDFL